ncbi:phage tail tape measure protein [Niallia circulans]|uniref:Phage tail tape measure protein n=1 Tax=Niallia circulans TaxID=1397 RepID=A0AA91TVH8_NIACI|nr:phage tail tape measure protein [Niallia circulans]PAD85018.1 phage tail tape measure protein [Niallia circulans]
MSDLKLRIIGTLNSKATITEVNKVISKIEKDLSKIKLNIQLDDKVAKSLTDYAKAMENYKNISSQLNRVLKEEKTITKDVNGVTKERISQQLKSGEIIQKEITRINNKNKATQKEIENTNKLQVAYDKLGQKQKQVTTQTNNGTSTSNQFKNGFTNTTVNSNVNGDVTSVKTVQNLDQERKATETLINSKNKLRDTLRLLNSEGKISSDSLSRLNNAVNSAKNIEQLNRLKQNIDNVNKVREMQNKLILAQREAELKVNNFKANSNLNSTQTAQLNAYLQSINSLTARTPQLNQRLREMSLRFNEITSEARNAGAQARTFGERVQSAFSFISVGMLTYGAFYGFVNTIKDMTNQVVELDTKMTNLRRVMDLPDYKFNDLMKESIALGDQLSNKIGDILDMYGGFGRMGYDENQLTAVSRTAQILQNVSDLTPDDTVNTLTAAMLNFNIAAEDSAQIADKLNEVDNNYAVNFCCAA